jgi:cystathionine beta-lyase/cystathionine gamma-synthase
LIDTPRIDPEDELICLGHGEDLEASGGAMSPPIVQTSLFAHETLDELMTGLSAEHRSHVYTRGQNPTVEAVETKLAQLERGEAAKCLASGMGAVSGVLFGLLEAGSHILFVNQTYGPTLQLAERLQAFGVKHDLVLDLNPEAIEAAIRPTTRIVWMESPGTMTFRLLDIAAVAEIARRHGALSAIDNTWATPLFQKPITAGVDLVMHTATRYLGGHSDLTAGVIVGPTDLLERIFYASYLLLGAALGPVDAWLVNRGLRTLPTRMRRHHANGLEVARFLVDHPRVRQVFHPGLVADPVLVEKHLSGFAGLLSFELDARSYEEVASVVDRLRLFRIGVSWGGVESLVIAPNRGDNAEVPAANEVPASTVRLSVGLEDPGALIDDLRQALDAS